LSGEEKKLLYKIRSTTAKDNSSGEYWRHLIPRTEQEYNSRTDEMPENIIIESRVNERLQWEDRQSVILPDGTKENREVICEAIIPSSEWYFIPLKPFTIKSVLNPIDPKNPYRSKEWRPQILDKKSQDWRDASGWEGEHWDDLVYCPSCSEPTIPQFQCQFCQNSIAPPLIEVEKRVLELYMILPDTPDFELTSSEETEYEKPEKPEPTELEDIVEEVVKEEQPEREDEDESPNKN
jgi:hypothetical protein